LNLITSSSDPANTDASQTNTILPASDNNHKQVDLSVSESDLQNILTKQEIKTDSGNYNLDHYRTNIRFMQTQMSNLFKKSEKKRVKEENLDQLVKKRTVLELERWILKRYNLEGLNILYPTKNILYQIKWIQILEICYLRI